MENIEIFEKQLEFTQASQYMMLVLSRFKNENKLFIDNDIEDKIISLNRALNNKNIEVQNKMYNIDTSK